MPIKNTGYDIKGAAHNKGLFINDVTFLRGSFFNSDNWPGGGGCIILTLSRILTWGGGGVQHRLKNSYVINECSLRICRQCSLSFDDCLK